MADFVFADEYRLEPGPTRRFFEHFLKGFVHKHNNLIGVVQGFSGLILIDDSIPTEIRESTEQMQNAARVATVLNREVLGASGCARCEPGAVRLADLLPFWKSKAEEIAASSGVSLAFRVSETLPPVAGDSTRLGEVFFHLVRNACEASAGFPGSAVEIDLLAPGAGSNQGTVDLFLRNRSADLDEGALRRSFQPFESSKGSEHFGLGLTAAAVLAGDMGLRLGLRSAEGTVTAWLALPEARG